MSAYDIISAALDGNAIKVKELFDDEVGARVLAKIDDMKKDMAASMFNNEPESVDEVIDTDDQEQE